MITTFQSTKLVSKETSEQLITLADPADPIALEARGRSEPACIVAVPTNHQGSNRDNAINGDSALAKKYLRTGRSRPRVQSDRRTSLRSSIAKKTPKKQSQQCNQ